MSYTKYRIVEKNEDFALQATSFWLETNKIKNSFWSKYEKVQIFHEVEWNFLEYKPITNSIWHSAEIITYKTKSAAQTALRKYLWENLVEPIESEKKPANWESVDKN